jgi:hypothetical protein
MTKKKTSKRTKETLVLTDQLIVDTLLKTVEYISLIDSELSVDAASEGKIMLEINLLRYLDKEYYKYDYSLLIRDPGREDHTLWGGVQFVNALNEKLHNFTLTNYNVYVGGDEYIDFRLEIHLAQVQNAKIIFT